MTEPLTITELTGSERSVELRDRALPHKPVAFPGEMRTERTHYPGNPVATIQVLGPDESTLEIRGRWKDRFIRRGGMVILDGWDALVSEGQTPTVEQLIQVFHAIRRSGNNLEVRWGPEIRRGVMKRFEPNYNRLDEVMWTMTFEWSQLGTALPSPFTSTRTTATMSAELAATLAAVNDAMAGMPTILVPNFIADALTLAGLIQVASIELMLSVSAVSGLPSVTQEEFQGISSKSDDVVTSCSSLRQAVGDGPPAGIVPVDDVTSIMETSTWSGETTEALIALAVAAVEARESIRSRVVSDYLADIRVREGQTLRDIAREYYGSGDAWPKIADANGLVGSIVSSGTRVLVPRREIGGGRVA